MVLFSEGVLTLVGAGWSSRRPRSPVGFVTRRRCVSLTSCLDFRFLPSGAVSGLLAADPPAAPATLPLAALSWERSPAQNSLCFAL